MTGPFTKEELTDALFDGTISAGATVREEENEVWFPIEQLQRPSLPAGSERQEPATTALAPVHHHHHFYEEKSSGIAVLLEILPGIFLQTFGIGNIYAGNVITGVILMITYWALTVVNFLLVFLFIGLITWPLTFCVYLVIAILTSQRAAELANHRAAHAVGRPGAYPPQGLPYHG